MGIPSRPRAGRYGVSEESSLATAACRRAREGVEGGLPEMPGLFRKRAEEAAARWLATNADRVGDIRVRFDFVSFLILDEGKALARHVVNALGGDVEERMC